MLRIEVQGHYTLNPSVIRVSASCYNVDEDGTESDYRYFELSIPTEDFTEDDGKGNVGINEQQFQQAVTNRVVAANKSANIAAFLDTRNLAWDVIIEPPIIEETPDKEDKIKLAFGSNDVSK